MTRIDFDRRIGMATAPGFDGFGGPFVATGADPYFDVCRMMADANLPDGPAVFVDETGLACMTVDSIQACARRYRPTDAEAIEDAAKAKEKLAEAKAKRARERQFHDGAAMALAELAVALRTATIEPKGTT